MSKPKNEVAPKRNPIPNKSSSVFPHLIAHFILYFALPLIFLALNQMRHDEMMSIMTITIPVITSKITLAGKIIFSNTSSTIENGINTGRAISLLYVNISLFLFLLFIKSFNLIEFKTLLYAFGALETVFSFFYTVILPKALENPSK